MGNQIEVYVTSPENGKRWAKVVFVSKHWKDWRPSFEDLFRIIQAISCCEDITYPPPKEGREKFRQLLNDCVNRCNKQVLATPEELTERWNYLKAKYEIP